MRNKIFVVLCFCFIFSACTEREKIAYTAAEVFELASPKLQADSLLFNNTAKVTAVFNLEGAEVRYTTDGTEVTSDALLYQNPITVNEPTEFVFRAFHSAYHMSEEARIRVLKVKKDISTAKVTVMPAPDSNYMGPGAMGLVNLQKGTLQFKTGNHWLGFQGEKIRIVLDFEKETSISKLIISSLNDQGSWIFLPKTIRIFADSKEEIGMLSVPLPTDAAPKNIALLDVSVVAGSYKRIEIQIDLLEAIPQWHQGKGTAPFFFIDEILVE